MICVSSPKQATSVARCPCHDLPKHRSLHARAGGSAGGAPQHGRAGLVVSVRVHPQHAHRSGVSAAGVLGADRLPAGARMWPRQPASCCTTAEPEMFRFVNRVQQSGQAQVRVLQRTSCMRRRSQRTGSAAARGTCTRQSSVAPCPPPLSSSTCRFASAVAKTRGRSKTFAARWCSFHSAAAP